MSGLELPCISGAIYLVFFKTDPETIERGYLITSALYTLLTHKYKADLYFFGKPRLNEV